MQFNFYSRFNIFIVLIFVSLLSTCASKEIQYKNRREYLEKSGIPFVNALKNGVVGDGVTDDTKALQELITKTTGDTAIYLPEGTYLVRALGLRSGVQFFSDGLIQQIKPDSMEYYSIEKQNSSFPLFRGHDVSGVTLSFKAHTYNEGLYISKSERINIVNTKLVGDSTKRRSFPAMLLYDCSDCKVTDSDISRYGVDRTSPTLYNPGTGIRVMNSRRVALRKNHIIRNGENGIFVHSSSDVSIDDNDIHANGMSAVQIAFGNAGTERDYIISHNRFHDNIADAVDINNRGLHGYLDINCQVFGNEARNNGFFNGETTPDGSGIATLINVSNVKLYDNKSRSNNRPAVYLEDCKDIHVHDNDADDTFEIVKTFENVLIEENKFDNLRLMANISGPKLVIKENKVRQLYLPNGIRVDSLLIVSNKISNANLNINFPGVAVLKNNEIRSKIESGAILVVRGKAITLDHNTIVSEAHYGIMTKRTATNVRIRDNKIEAANACISDEGAPGLLVSGNKLKALKGGLLQRTFISSNPDNLTLIKNEHRAGKNDNSVRLSGKGTAHIEGEKNISGYPEYGAIVVTSP